MASAGLSGPDFVWSWLDMDNALAAGDLQVLGRVAAVPLIFSCSRPGSSRAVRKPRVVGWGPHEKHQVAFSASPGMASRPIQHRDTASARNRLLEAAQHGDLDALEQLARLYEPLCNKN